MSLPTGIGVHGIVNVIISTLGGGALEDRPRGEDVGMISNPSLCLRQFNL